METISALEEETQQTFKSLSHTLDYIFNELLNLTSLKVLGHLLKCDINNKTLMMYFIRSMISMTNREPCFVTGKEKCRTLCIINV